MEKQYCTECGKPSDVLITDYRHNVNNKMVTVIRDDEHLCGSCASLRKYYKDLTTINELRVTPLKKLPRTEQPLH